MLLAHTAAKTLFLEALGTVLAISTQRNTLLNTLTGPTHLLADAAADRARWQVGIHAGVLLGGLVAAW